MIQLFGESFTYTSKIDNKDYIFSALTIGDLADYCLWFQFKELEDYKRVSSEFVSSASVSKFEKEIYERCLRRRIEFSDDIVIQSFGSIDGIIRQLYLSIRKHDTQKNIKSSDITNIVLPEDFKMIKDKISFLSGIVVEEEEDEILGES